MGSFALASGRVSGGELSCDGLSRTCDLGEFGSWRQVPLTPDLATAWRVAGSVASGSCR